MSVHDATGLDAGIPVAGDKTNLHRAVAQILKKRKATDTPKDVGETIWTGLSEADPDLAILDRKVTVSDKFDEVTFTLVHVNGSREGVILRIVTT